MAQSIKQLIDEYVRWLRQGISVARIGDAYEITTPFLDRHNDHIQIMGGGPWTIVGNRFGDRGGGAASVFVSEGPNNTSNRVHDVLVESNIFKGKSTGHYGVVLGGSVGGGVGLRRGGRRVS